MTVPFNFFVYLPKNTICFDAKKKKLHLCDQNKPLKKWKQSKWKKNVIRLENIVVELNSKMEATTCKWTLQGTKLVIDKMKINFLEHKSKRQRNENERIE